MTVMDKDSANPRLQCGECGRWMRLHGKRLEAVDGKVKEVSFQRFYGGCSATEGDHPCGGDVCHVCCPSKCLVTLAETPTSSETPGVHRDEKHDELIMRARALTSQERKVAP